MLSLLPEIESKDGKTGPYRGGRRAFGQHSAQREPTFEQADASFDAAPEPLQLFEPATVLMPSLSCAQPSDLRNTDSTESQPTKLVDIVRAVIAAIGSQLSRHLLENLLGLADQRNKLGLVVGIAPMDFIMNNHSRIVLDQLQGAAKLHGLVEFALHNSPSLGIEKRNNAFWDRTFSAKFVLGLLNQLLRELNGLAKLLLELGGRRGRELLESLTAVLRVSAASWVTFLRIFLPWALRCLGLALELAPQRARAFLVARTWLTIFCPNELAVRLSVLTA